MPTIAAVHSTDLVLTNLAIVQGRNRFIGSEIFPEMDVTEKTAKIYEIDPNFEAMRDQDVERAPGAEAKTADFQITKPITFNAQDRALTGFVPDEFMAVRNPAIQAHLDKVQFLRDKLELNREIKIFNQLVTDLTGAQTSSPAVKWDAATGDAVVDISAQMDVIEQNTGFSPNVLAIDKKVMRAIRDSATFQDRAKYVQIVTGSATATILAEILGLERVVVADIAIKNTAAANATASLSRIWDETVILARVDPPALEYGGLGLTFTWTTGDTAVRGTGGIVQGWRVETWRENKRKSDAMMLSRYYDIKTIKAAAGHRFTNTLT